MKILECSSKGDKRFSALYANLTFGGVNDTIENHYQLSKRFGKIKPTTWREAKGKFPTHLEVFGTRLESKEAHNLYRLLWLMYLDRNPKLVEYARKYDKLNDMFSRKGAVNQAEIIQEYLDDRNSMKSKCQNLIDTLVFRNKPIKIEDIGL